MDREQIRKIAKQLNIIDDTLFQKMAEDAYSGKTAHPFQRNGAPFRLKLSKAQLVN